MNQHTLHVLQRHMERLYRRIQALESLSRRYSWVRGGIVLVGLALVFAAGRLGVAGWDWAIAAVFTALFIAVAVYHGRVKRSIARHHIWRHIKGTQVARMRRDWAHIPPPSATSLEAEHPFAIDLDVTGTHSLHRLLDTAMSHGGSERLRAWLLTPTPDVVPLQARQVLVRELVPLTRFRDRLTLNGVLVAQGQTGQWDGERLLAWLAQRPPQASLAGWVVVLGALAVTNIVLGVLHALALLPALWAISFVVYSVLYLAKHGEAAALSTEAFQLEKTLQQFRAVWLYLEAYRYDQTSQLAKLCAPFWQTLRRPSASLKKIVGIAGAAGIQHNLMGALVNAAVPWDLYFAHRLNQCKEDIRADLPVWLETWYELEALNALAAFAAGNPDYVFPDLIPLTELDHQPVFVAHQLGHPLLPDETRVCNDFCVEHLGQMTLITGSNMSGKSTFLRTVGINLCLAYAGGPVNAIALQTVPFRLFTCIKVSDSVTDGISYFYAEVRRLKALLQALHQEDERPVFFLIDEIFRGTNNRERLIGAHAYLQALAGGHGVGIVSTHDLDLVTLSEAIAGTRNSHFREDVHAGRMVFDYQLRPGPCPTTNALKIMQMEGLPVPG